MPSDRWDESQPREDQCPHGGAQISAYVDGELGPLAAGALRRHLAECAACAAELNALQGLSSRFVAGAAAVPALGDFSRASLHRAIDALPDPGVLRIARFLAAAAACVLLAGTWWLWYAAPRDGGAPVALAPVAPRADVRNEAPAAPIAPWEGAVLAARGDGSVTSSTDAVATTTPAAPDVPIAEWIVADLSLQARQPN